MHISNISSAAVILSCLAAASCIKGTQTEGDDDDNPFDFIDEMGYDD